MATVEKKRGRAATRPVTPETMRTEVRAEARFVRAAPRKAQLVAEQIRGRPVAEARTILAFMTRDAARDVEKVLNSAVANAETNPGLVGDELYVSAAYVGAGPTLKRWRARARGRVARIKKRTCHITIRLARVGARAIPEPRGSVVLEPPAPEPAEDAPKRKRASRKKGEPAEKGEEKPNAEKKPASRRRAAGKSTPDDAAKPSRPKRKKES